MKISYFCVLIALPVSLPALAGQTLPDLSGTYRVRGECHERTDSGDYKRCVAWNQLVLKPGDTAGSYRYTLDTNTFATTQGGCALEGTVSLEAQGKHLYLSAPTGEADVCPIRFKVDKKALSLEMSQEQVDTATCRNLCSSNSSLYTDPFPRASRKK